MKIVFLSNGYCHHQVYLSRNLYKLTNGQFHFFAQAPLTERRKKLGYPEIKDDFVDLFDGKNQDIQNIIDSADVVIHGAAPEQWIENRKKLKKLIFRYSERPLKKGFQWYKYPYRFVKWHCCNPHKTPIYMLCASAYTAEDYHKFGLFKDKCFKFGYFPECKHYPNIDELISQKTANEILWCGRFLDWKHPDDVLEIARRLKADGKAYHITMVGMGEMKEKLEKLRDLYELSDYITFTGSISADKVREYMEKASIYLFTSDRKEGWGAVLNEAMNSACAIVASDAAGSTPYLIQDGKNGIVYHIGNVDSLFKSVEKLLDDSELRQALSVRAYETIVDEWNAEKAAERFVELAENVLAGEKSPQVFKSGLCSKV